MAKTTFMLIQITFLFMFALAQAKRTPVIAPGPTPSPLNLTAILEKGGQYTTLIRLLNETQVGEQIQNQLNNSFQGLTILAPTDNAFNALKPGTFNSLTPQEQVSLVLYHVLPRFYSLSSFETASNPVRTQASGSSGPYTLNVTSSANSVNVSTGIDETVISNEVYSDFPLAVYSVESVLLPYDIFGVKPPAPAPAPQVAPKKGEKKKGKGTAAAKGPAASDEAVTSTEPSDATSFKSKSSIIGIIGLFICVGYVF